MEKSIPKVALPNPADYVTYRLAYGCRELLNLLELLPRVLADLDFPFWSGAHKIPARCQAGEETELVPDKRGHEKAVLDGVRWTELPAFPSPANLTEAAA